MRIVSLLLLLDLKMMKASKLQCKNDVGGDGGNQLTAVVMIMGC